MWRKFGLSALALMLIVVSFLLIVVSATPASAHSLLPLATPTVVGTADDALTQAQNLLNVIGVFAAVLGVVLALLALIGAVLTALGIRSYREVNGQAKELRANLEKMQKEAGQTRQALMYISLGDRLLNQKSTAEALEYYKKAGNLLPNDPQINYVLGRIYSSLGDFDAAISTLKAAHSEQPLDQARVLKELGLAYRRRAVALKQNSDYDEAIKYLKMSVDLNPDDADTLAIIGGLYRRKKEYTHALDFYERAWRRNPGLSYALGNLASLSWYLGKKSEALMYFGYTEIAAEGRLKRGLTEPFWDYYDLALARLASGKIPEAKEAYTKAIQGTPGNVQFDAVLDNLYLLRQAPQAMPGLDEVVQMIESAKVK